jgi:hypothetical protein
MAPVTEEYSPAIGSEDHVPGRIWTRPGAQELARGPIPELNTFVPGPGEKG